MAQHVFYLDFSPNRNVKIMQTYHFFNEFARPFPVTWSRLNNAYGWILELVQAMGKTSKGYHLTLLVAGGCFYPPLGFFLNISQTAWARILKFSDFS